MISKTQALDTEMSLPSQQVNESHSETLALNSTQRDQFNTQLCDVVDLALVRLNSKRLSAHPRVSE